MPKPPGGPSFNIGKLIAKMNKAQDGGMHEGYWAYVLDPLAHMPMPALASRGLAARKGVNRRRRSDDIRKDAIHA